RLPSSTLFPYTTLFRSSELATQENKLFMATGPHIMELTGSRCSSHTFAFMPNARMMAQAVTPHIVKVFGKQWYMVTADTVDGKRSEEHTSELQSPDHLV